MHCMSNGRPNILKAQKSFCNINIYRAYRPTIKESISL